MKTIELSDKTPFPFNEYCRDNKSLIARRIAYPYKTVDQLKFLGNPDEDVVFHEGFIGYLTKAWSRHYSVVLSPDIVWFTILNEITAAVAKKSDKYANLFTTTPGEKQAVIVLTGDPEVIDPAAVVDALKSRVPSNVDDFIPKFSTTTPEITMAMNVAFCDLVSPYYEYFTLCCGFPSIRIEGTEADWTLLMSKIKSLASLFKDSLDHYLHRCLNCVVAFTCAAANNYAEHFQKMVKLYPCGSGHEVEIDGWILDLFNDTGGSKRVRTERIPPHFANMSYTNLDTNRKFKLYSGMFYSKIEGSFMVPCFDSVRYEIKTKEQEEKEKHNSEAEEYALGVFKMVSTPAWVSEENKGIVYAPYIPRIKNLDNQ